MKLNKGEWGEPYVALKLLGDGKLQMADGNGEVKPGEWMDVVELIRHETADRVVTYGRDAETTMIDVDINGDSIASLPAEDFLEAANRLSHDIRTGKGASFEVSDEVNNFFLLAQMLTLKAKSVDKSDIFLTTLDPRSAVTRSRIGFSIKSKFGQNPTLFNTAPASGVRYRLDGCTKADMEAINGIVDDKGHVAVGNRCSAILDRGLKPIYVGYAIAKRAGCEAFKDNLDIIDPRLPLVIEKMLWNHFFEGDTAIDIPDVVNRIIRENPCEITRPDVKYPYMIKSFMYAAYCGMTASTLWNGNGQVNGGFITVDEDGTVLAHYALESEEFKAYLYNNCYLEFPATSKGHGNYAKVYEEDGEFYFHLNFQIRYR